MYPRKVRRLVYTDRVLFEFALADWGIGFLLDSRELVAAVGPFSLWVAIR